MSMTKSKVNVCSKIVEKDSIFASKSNYARNFWPLSRNDGSKKTVM